LDRCLQVTVVDKEQPGITCPSNILVKSQKSSEVITWTAATAQDNVDKSPVVTVSVAPGASFAIGSVTTITYTATDSAKNAKSCTFTVTVQVRRGGFPAALAFCPCLVCASRHPGGFSGCCPASLGLPVQRGDQHGKGPIVGGGLLERSHCV
jgi:hypothetical protein